MSISTPNRECGLERTPSLSSATTASITSSISLGPWSHHNENGHVLIMGDMASEALRLDDPHRKDPHLRPPCTGNAREPYTMVHHPTRSCVDTTQRTCGAEGTAWLQPGGDESTVHFPLGGVGVGVSRMLESRMLEVRVATLVAVDLSFRNLRCLPRVLGDCVSLAPLVLTGNPLERLPSFLGDFVNLQSIEADQCSLFPFPAALSRLSGLRLLSVRSNQFVLPSWIYLLPRLEALYVDGNPFDPDWMRVVSPILLQSRSLQTQQSLKPNVPSATRTFSNGPSHTCGASARPPVPVVSDNIVDEAKSTGIDTCVSPTCWHKHISSRDFQLCESPLHTPPKGRKKASGDSILSAVREPALLSTSDTSVRSRLLRPRSAPQLRINSKDLPVCVLCHTSWVQNKLNGDPFASAAFPKR